MRKLIEYFPTMVVTNISVLLLISIDGLVVGNLIGEDALSSVSFFSPIDVTISIVTSLVSCGAATCISTCMGRQDREEIGHLKSAVNVTMVVSALLMAVGQIPIVYLMISSYDLDPEMNRLVWQYGIGVMVATPFGIVSTVGVYQMQIMGKMKYLLYLSVMEGLVNTGLDLLFVGPLDMGVAGAGFGSAGANVIRCTVTVIILWRMTDIYKTGGARPRGRDFRDILSSGLPDGANTLMLAVQNFCIMHILLSAFGSDGGVIRGVCNFCFSLTNVFILGLQGSVRPLTGLMSGARDAKGLQILMRQGMTLMTVIMAIMMSIILLFPGFFYQIHGVDQIPEGGILSLRIYSTFLIFKGMNALFRLYFANRKDKKYGTGLIILGNGTLPIFAFVLLKLCPAPWVWLSFLMTEAIILILNLWRYRWWRKEDAREENEDAKILYLSVRPDEAEDASRMVRDCAEREGVPADTIDRVTLCMVEMILSTANERQFNEVRRLIRSQLRKGVQVHQERTARIRQRHNNDKGMELFGEYRAKRRRIIEDLDLSFDPLRDVHQFHKELWEQLSSDDVEMQMILRLAEEDSRMVVIDDGRALALEESEDLREGLDEKMELIRNLSSSVEYQYILNMNYTTVKF